MNAVEQELRNRGLWTAGDDQLSGSIGTKSSGLAAIDFRISDLGRTGQLFNETRNAWRVPEAVLATHRDVPSAPKESASEMAVRIVPMSSGESDDISIPEQQNDYFLGELSGNLNGTYYCHTLLQAEAGTPVLFQYQGRIIASARLLRGEELSRPNRYGYAKAMIFDLSSICVFEPVTAEQMKVIWPDEFKAFSQATKKLSLAPLDRFFELVRSTIRTPKNAKTTSAEPPSVPGGWMASDKGHTRSATDATEVSADHAKMQRKLVEQLVKQYGAANVITEQDHVDIRVTTPTEEILFEIKSDESPAAVIRQAIGQLLEYAYLSPKKSTRRLSLVVVGRNKPNDQQQAYIERLSTVFGLPLSYQTVSL